MLDLIDDGDPRLHETPTPPPIIDKSKCWVYDIETYPNFFCFVAVNLATRERYIFEISPRRDDSMWLWWFLDHMEAQNCYLIGYNNVGFDWPVIDCFRNYGFSPYANSMILYQKAQAIIDSPRNDWTHSVPEWKQTIRQIDLYKICHFDNFARSTSLKKLEIAMRSPTVEDLPVKPGTNLHPDQFDPMITYCCWDVSETLKFALEIWDRIEFRLELDKKYGGRKSRLNYNDTKIGKEFFLDELRKQGIQTHNNRQPNQTPRAEGIKVADILLPMQFTAPSLQWIYDVFRNSMIPAENTKGFFTDMSADLRGITLDFGSGGIHGSIHKRTVHSDDEYVIIDADVTSYYPSLAIKYGWYPLHLTDRFVPIYGDLKEQRISHAKGTAPNAMLKLALNGTYGESNNKHSAFYDPQFTMSITINGQLLLSYLMEMLLTNEAVEPIQINTDGLTIRLPRTHLDWYYDICNAWSEWSRMDLEYVEYRTMAIRDVNNYIAIDTKGKVKTKGAYAPDPDWHQDHSSLVVQKAVKEHVENGTRIDQFIYGHTDAFDFMRAFKATGRGTSLWWGSDQVQNTSRYYIALNGRKLTKQMPPLKGDTDNREIGIDKDWDVALCNRAWDFDWHNLNRRMYLMEAEKLAAGLGL